MAKLEAVKQAPATLAKPLAKLAEVGGKVEQAAMGLLTAIRHENIRTLGMFDDYIAAAYTENGWNARPGRPSGKERRAVPHTVRTYVWEIRSAYRAELEVWKFRTMYQLRTARKAAKDAEREAAQASETTTDTPQMEEGETIGGVEVTPEVQQDLMGVRIVAPRQPNGALFHDLIACFIALPGEERALFGRQLARLLHRYQSAVGQQEVKVEGKARRKSA